MAQVLIHSVTPEAARSAAASEAASGQSKQEVASQPPATSRHTAQVRCSTHHQPLSCPEAKRGGALRRLASAAACSRPTTLEPATSHKGLLWKAGCFLLALTCTVGGGGGRSSKKKASKKMHLAAPGKSGEQRSFKKKELHCKQAAWLAGRAG